MSLVISGTSIVSITSPETSPPGESGAFFIKKIIHENYSLAIDPMLNLLGISKYF